MANVPLKSIKFPGLSDTYTVPQIDSTLTQQGKAADAKKTGISLMLLSDDIPDTTQTYTFVDGTVSQVTHSRNGTVVRTDAFTYETSTITEVRTLNTGESLTIVTNLTTLETSVTYAAA